MESEHLQTLINIKQIFELSQSRGCWKLDEAKNVVTLYERLCIIIQHYEKSKELNTIQEENEIVETVDKVIDDISSSKTKNITVEEMENTD